MTAEPFEFVPQVAALASNFPVNHFNRARLDGSLELRPPYQRNLVWNVEQQSFLIDSMLRGLPVPEIYVQTTTSPQGRDHIVVVDGQQRLNACLAFIAGNLRLVGQDDLDPRWRSRVFDELEDELKSRFLSYELIVRKLPPVGDPALREIFRRLNKTVEALTPQELRHAAYTGPFIKFIEAAVGAAFLQEIGVFTPRDYLRRRSDELLSEIALAVIAGAYPNKKDGLSELFHAYDKQGVPPGVLEDLSRRFGRVFSQLEPISPALRRTRFKNKSDFYTLCVVLAHNAESLPLDRAGAEVLLSSLQDFASRVDGLKRDENDGRDLETAVSDALDVQALKYLRAVERAASDRQSRVRRDEALSDVIGAALATGKPTPLTVSDESWVTELEAARNGDADESDEADETEERTHAQDLLREDELARND